MKVQTTVIKDGVVFALHAKVHALKLYFHYSHYIIKHLNYNHVFINNRFPCALCFPKVFSFIFYTRALIFLTLI